MKDELHRHLDGDGPEASLEDSTGVKPGWTLEEVQRELIIKTLAQHGGNRPSYLFWKRVIDAYTGGQYVKQALENEHLVGQAITFDNSK